jgi:hypothetical protein
LSTARSAQQETPAIADGGFDRCGLDQPAVEDDGAIAGASTDDDAAGAIGVASEDDAAIGAASDDEAAIGAASEDDAVIGAASDDEATGAASDDDEATGAASDDDTTAELEAVSTGAVVGVPRLKIQIRPMMTITATMMIIQVLRFMGFALGWRRKFDREEF